MVSLLECKFWKRCIKHLDAVYSATETATDSATGVSALADKNRSARVPLVLQEEVVCDQVQSEA